MKRLVCLLLVLLLPLTALAEDTPARVTEQLYSNTGNTSITIDADVFAPYAEAVPRYQVRLREFTEEEVYAMADALFGGRAYTSDGYENFYNNETNKYMGRDMFVETIETVDTHRGVDSPVYQLWVSSWHVASDMLDLVQAELSGPQIIGENYFFPTVWLNHVPEDGPHSCAISQEDARALANAAVARFAPYMTLAAEGMVESEKIQAGNPVDLILEHQGWGFAYTRDLPLPMTFEFTTPSNDYGWPVCRETIIIAVDDEGIRSMRFENPFEITQVLDESCELLPFEQIMDIARTIFPLSTGWLESSYGDVREYIDHIKLGYMVMLSRDNAAYCEVVPVWDFFGRRECRMERDGEIISDNDFPFHSLLTINAIDGTIIDRKYGY